MVAGPDAAGSVGAVNQVKNRLQSLGLIERALTSASDEDLAAALESLSDEHRDAIDELAGPSAGVDGVRAAATRGRMDGTMESLALVLSDACLADCIEALGDSADHPSSEELREVLPAIIDEHGIGITRLMLATTVAGEAPAAAIIRDLLKHDETVKLPPAETRAAGPVARAPKVDSAEREAIKAKRKELKKQKQEAARARREQSERDRGR